MQNLNVSLVYIFKKRSYKMSPAYIICIMIDNSNITIKFFKLNFFLKPPKIK